MKTPIRIQRKRTAGWRMPEGAVYVGRPTIWGNPWSVGTLLVGGAVLSPTGAKEKYRDWVASQIRTGVLDLEKLVGHDLACWCALGVPCHADVLIELAGAYAPRLGQRVLGGPNR